MYTLVGYSEALERLGEDCASYVCASVLTTSLQKWPGSVEANTFTLNLYELVLLAGFIRLTLISYSDVRSYFVDLTREARREAALSQSFLRPGAITIQTSLVVHQSPISPVSDAGGDDVGDEQCTTGPKALEDYWCTRYFSFRNMSIFMEGSLVLV